MPQRGWLGLVFGRLFSGPGYANYNRVLSDETDGDENASTSFVGLRSLPQHFRARFGGYASTALFLSFSGVLFLFAVLGEEFSTAELAFTKDNASVGDEVARTSLGNSSLSHGGSQPVLVSVNASSAWKTQYKLYNASTVVVVPGSGGASASSASHPNFNDAGKSSIFYWTLAVGTLAVFVAIVRSLVILRRALIERSAAAASGRAFAFASRARGIGGIPRGLSLSDLINGNLGNLRSHLQLMGRELNENDFEVLTQLDAINQGVGLGGEQGAGGGAVRGASERTINRLPLHTITSAEIASKAEHDSNSQSCAVCMEPFEVGATVRTVLCLHSFHQQCIDPWLRLHASCPICKCSVEESGGEWEGGD